MKKRKYLLAFLLVGLFYSSYSQDIHFSNYYYTPLYLSPAKTGDFASNYRVGGAIRDQFSSFFENPYQTVLAYVDTNIDFGFGEKHWISVGMNIHADRAGDLSYSNSGMLGSIAYHLPLDPSYKTVITAGVQYGVTQRNINGDSFRSEETLAGNNNDPDRMLLNDFNPSINDLNVGIDIKRWTSKTAYFNVGIAMNHILKPEFRFSGSNIDNPVDRRMNIYAEYYVQSTKQLALRPMVVYSKIYNFTNLYGQFNVEYRVNKKSSTLIKGGLGYRSGDALQMLAGLIYKGWDVGLAYDMTVSSAADYNSGFGAIELGVKKIFIVNKKPKVKLKALCPRL